ncbi:VOC family protein [Paenibacillus sp. Y412MC10]|uniref:VOC family protein n=1 Tax=Geobacillus sp. (strain Y412MC10) TaxID=481743 RepID=UPI001642AD92|nr:VOC family protein [Paenibacillus sp. Y412MC10]
MELLSGYIYIPVTNLERSEAWYAKYLHFETAFEDPLYVEMRSTTGIRIMLIVSEEAVNSQMTYSNGPQAAYGFVVPDIDQARQWLMDHGIEVRRISNYQGKSFGFYDPDGNIIELWSDYPKA